MGRTVEAYLRTDKSSHGDSSNGWFIPGMMMGEAAAVPDHENRHFPRSSVFCTEHIHVLQKMMLDVDFLVQSCMAPIWVWQCWLTEPNCFAHCVMRGRQAPVQPVTMNMHHSMNSWYDLVGLSERDAEQCDGIDDSKVSEPSTLRLVLAPAINNSQQPLKRLSFFNQYISYFQTRHSLSCPTASLQPLCCRISRYGPPSGSCNIFLSAMLQATAVVVVDTSS
jgi:hypothetical protein